LEATGHQLPSNALPTWPIAPDQSTSPIYMATKSSLQCNYLITFCGRSGASADVTIHVAAENYGTVEDVHQSIMHILAQYLRLSRMGPDLIAQRHF
jgi:hypothetical protein